MFSWLFLLVYFTLSDAKTQLVCTDASVTQSAMEEALASNMGDAGTIGSLKGTISNAFRSRYLPKSNQ